jgi:GT2 family glycosyltransferase
MNLSSNRIVSIIIVTCAKGDYLKGCLDSLRGQTYPDSEIIVVDNSSIPAFSREISTSYPGIKIFSGSRNLSYCQSLNQGIKMSRGSFTLCLNDDVVLDKEYIREALVGFKGQRVGMVSGKILRSNKNAIDSTGLFLSYWRTAKERGYGLKDRRQFEKSGYIFGVNGAVAFYLREMLEEIKEGEDYFDPDFHFFYEDLDLAWRAQQFGWKGYYVPKAIAYHVRGGSVRIAYGKDRPYARRYLNDALLADLIKNRYLTMIKHESFLSFFIHLPGIILFELFSFGYVLFFRPKIIKTIPGNLRYLPGAVRKRRINFSSLKC